MLKSDTLIINDTILVLSIDKPEHKTIDKALYRECVFSNKILSENKLKVRYIVLAFI